MKTVYTVVIALLVFGFLILIHELGHFIAAKKCGVKVNEFSIGMGPTIFSKEIGETTYALRLLPVGGFVAMEGDDDGTGGGLGDVTDSRAFCNKSIGSRFIVMVAGAAMNLLLGYIIMLVLTTMSTAIATPVIHSFPEGAVTSQYFKPGDKIVRMDGHRIRTANDISFHLMREADGIMDVEVLRDGKSQLLNDVHFQMVDAQGISMVKVDFIVEGLPKTWINVPVYAFDWTISIMKQVWFSLWDLVFSNRYGIEQMSGPVGVASAISTASSKGMDDFLMMVAVITLNLGVFNLLPLPALDGGRIFFIAIEKIRGKPINPKIEGYINTAGLMALMGLMLFVTFNDVLKFF